MSHHKDGPTCPLCNDKLTQAHPYLVEWFGRVKKLHNSVHVACAWRNADEQNKTYIEGRSRVPWPKSKHNVMVDNKPCALALDLFQIDADGVARWSWPFYKLIDKENKEAKEPIAWGGNFTKITDGPHFELMQPIEKVI